MADVKEVEKELDDTIKAADAALKKDDDASADQKMDPEARKQLEDAKKTAQELLDSIRESGKVEAKDPKFLQVAKALGVVLEKLAGKAPPGIKQILKAYVKIFEAGAVFGAMTKYNEYKKLRDQGVPPDDPTITDISSDQVILDWYEVIYILRKAEKEAEEAEKKRKEQEKKDKEEKEKDDTGRTVKSVLYIEGIVINISIH